VAGGTKKYEVLPEDSPDGQKHEYEGISDASIFDPVKQTYEKVTSMNYARWYPTLVTLADGTVVTVAGLDGNGDVDAGHTEIYNPSTDVWTDRKDLNRVWPTYPSLSLTASGKLFYSGANTGYGDQKVGRTPGLWDLATNAFTPFANLPDPTLTETSMSVLLPPAQNQTYAIFGGGGVGDSPVVTARTATIDLNDPNPTWERGPDLTVPKRYPDVVTLPDDTVLVTNGAEAYRDKDSKTAEIYHPDTRTFTPAADPKIGRDYHTEAVLLPDGRVATFGSNPLKLNAFETRVEVYSPPYLFKGPRPQIQAAPEEVGFGSTIDIAADQSIAKVRLVRPSAVTHMTDTAPRSGAADIVSQGNGHLKVTIPTNQNILPSDWYMMFVVNDAGVPSVAKWVHVG
jgi:hypothetical protein